LGGDSGGADADWAVLVHFQFEENAMQRFAGIAILVVGIILVVWGANASQSFSSEVSRVFTGAATNKAIYMILGGAVAALVGASLAFTPRGKRA
jgi:drug/metabolite transporter (DMT)-like permease